MARQAGTVSSFLMGYTHSPYTNGHEIHTPPDAPMPALRLDVAPAAQTPTRHVREPALPLAVLGSAPAQAHEAPEEAVNMDDVHSRLIAAQEQRDEYKRRLEQAEPKEHTMNWSDGQIASFILLGLVAFALIIWSIRTGR